MTVPRLCDFVWSVFLWRGELEFERVLNPVPMQCGDLYAAKAVPGSSNASTFPDEKMDLFRHEQQGAHLSALCDCKSSVHSPAYVCAYVCGCVMSVCV